MSEYMYDLIIIGGGSGGLVAARVGAALGARVCLIDKERLGGDCLHYGCIPSKSLIYAARIVKNLRVAAAFGTGGAIDHFEVDMAKIADHIHKVIERIGVAEQIYVQQVEVQFGEAEFVSNHELKLNGQILTGRSFIVATGSQPNTGGIEGLAGLSYLTTQDIFDLNHLPHRLAIAGGGPVGVEMAQAFARLGSRVTLIHSQERLLPGEDAAISGAIAAVLSREGVELITGARLTKVSEQGLSKLLEARRGEELLYFKADELMLAIGRRPNLTGLKLENAGITLSDKGIVVNEYLQTASPNIYAIGDVTGGYLFTHVAAYQAGIAARNALVPVGRKRPDYRVLPWITFTDPEASRVGLTEAEARRLNPNIKVQYFPWEEIDRAQTEGETEGFIKLILDEQGEQILGAHLVGAHSGEMLGEITLAMQHKIGISGILQAIHAYPTLSTGLQSTAFEAYLSSSSLTSARKVRRPVFKFSE
ncbi:MAG TPA: NAD(P)/FAD-dependent oxidoreductase [Chloroflexia bacterium]|nr:NAD(P)/FAD-dependent oxidoreductase [Chloroflexia bacterium]